MVDTTAKHFVLIHGVSVGAWCWYKLVVLLKNAGHKVSAIDLAASGRNMERIEDLHSIDEYHKPLFLFMEQLSPQDKVILVGHSLGGHVVASAMERFPEKIAFAVFVAAFMVGPHLTLDQINFRLTGSHDDSQSVATIDWDYSKVYQNSPPEDIELASLLLRVSTFFNDPLSKRQVLVTEKRYGSIHRAYVIAGSDLAMPVDLQKWMVENNPPDEEYEIKEADHMVMISKPQELCNILVRIARTLNSN